MGEIYKIALVAAAAFLINIQMSFAEDYDKKLSEIKNVEAKVTQQWSNGYNFFGAFNKKGLEAFKTIPVGKVVNFSSVGGLTYMVDDFVKVARERQYKIELTSLCVSSCGLFAIAMSDIIETPYGDSQIGLHTPSAGGHEASEAAARQYVEDLIIGAGYNWELVAMANRTPHETMLYLKFSDLKKMKM